MSGGPNGTTAKEGQYRKQYCARNTGDDEPDSGDDRLGDCCSKDAVDHAADCVACDLDESAAAIASKVFDNHIESACELGRITQQEECEKCADEDLRDSLADGEADRDKAGAGP